MERTLISFVRALRRAEVRVSPAETLDALRMLALVGVADRARLRTAFSLVLAKSPEDKQRFAECFDRFFAFDAFAAPATRSHLVAPSVTQDLARALVATGDGKEGLAEQLLSDDRAALAHRLAGAATTVEVSEMRALRDKSGRVSALLDELGIASLDAIIARLPGQGDDGAELARWLRGARTRLQREVRDYVEAQYRVHVDASGRRGIVDAAIAANLEAIPPAYYDDVRAVVRRIAQRLTERHRRRRRRARRGQLDLRNTLRRNLAYDGTLFDLRWRRVRVERPQVFAVCDVSGSVARIARFTLLLLYSLNEVLPFVRTFVFSSSLAEVSELFGRLPPERAIEEALLAWGKGATDYARAFTDLRGLCLTELDRRSTVIVLGDGRNNYFEPRPEILAEISRRAGQVIWLNPEPRTQWQVGDSAMARYAPYCTRVATVNSLRDLERFADRLLLSLD